MSTIIYDARRIKAFESIQMLGQKTNKSKEFIDALWKNIVLDGDLMEEFSYYLDYHTFMDHVKIEGYGLTDLYMYLLRQNDIQKDYGKNGFECDKDTLALEVFYHFIEMRKNPEPYVRSLEDGFGQGMDQL